MEQIKDYVAELDTAKTKINEKWALIRQDSLRGEAKGESEMRASQAQNEEFEELLGVLCYCAEKIAKQATIDFLRTEEKLQPKRKRGKSSEEERLAEERDFWKNQYQEFIQDANKIFTHAALATEFIVEAVDKE